jgi:hypothetical protein
LAAVGCTEILLHLPVTFFAFRGVKDLRASYRAKTVEYHVPVSENPSSPALQVDILKRYWITVRAAPSFF